MHPLELCFRYLRVQHVKIAFVFHRVGSVKIFNELFNNSCQFFLKARPWCLFGRRMNWWRPWWRSRLLLLTHSTSTTAAIVIRVASHKAETLLTGCRKSGQPKTAWRFADQFWDVYDDCDSPWTFGRGNHLLLALCLHFEVEDERRINANRFGYR